MQTKIIEIYDSNNNHTNLINYEIENRMIMNRFQISQPIIYNTDLIKEIIDEYDELTDEIKSGIYELIDENSSNYYFKSDASDTILKDNKEYEIKYDAYNKAFNDSYSLLDLLKLFDEIESEFKSYYDLYKKSENESKYDNSSCYELIEYIISEINDKFLLKTDLYEMPIILNISSKNILENNLIYFSQDLFYDTIRNELIYSDLYSSCLYDLYEMNNSYESKFNTFMIDYNESYDSIYELFESVLIDMYNNSYTDELEYEYESDEYYNKTILTIKLKDLMKLNEIISESDKYENRMNFYPENISELFKNSNNALDENFIYDYYDTLTENLINSDKIYYELYSNNSYLSGINKCYSIFELIELVLNRFKHYNLNNSFKFNNECYELY